MIKIENDLERFIILEWLGIDYKIIIGGWINKNLRMEYFDRIGRFKRWKIKF